MVNFEVWAALKLSRSWPYGCMGELRSSQTEQHCSGTSACFVCLLWDEARKVVGGQTIKNLICSRKAFTLYPGDKDSKQGSNTSRFCCRKIPLAEVLRWGVAGDREKPGLIEEKFPKEWFRRKVASSEKRSKEGEQGWKEYRECQNVWRLDLGRTDLDKQPAWA